MPIEPDRAVCRRSTNAGQSHNPDSGKTSRRHPCQVTADGAKGPAGDFQLTAPIRLGAIGRRRSNHAGPASCDADLHLLAVLALSAHAETLVWRRDRKSTRLNSSHLGISYAV